MKVEEMEMKKNFEEIFRDFQANLEVLEEI